MKFGLIIATMSLSFFTNRLHADEVETVHYVEIQNYLGKWHEVMRIPNSFQEGCKKSTAEYRLNKNGTLRVINRCEKTKQNGKVKKTRAKGKAWIANRDTNAELDVSFACIWRLCFRKFSGDYWVLGLGPLNEDDQYSWAVVGSPDRRYGWILSRTKELNEGSLEEAGMILEENGFDLEDFVDEDAEADIE